MLQAILEDRFKLRIRRQTREIPVYVLTVAADGPKLQPFTEGTCTSTLDHPASPIPEQSKQRCQQFGMVWNGRYKMDAQGISVEQFSRTFLSASLGRPVIYKTGVGGYFDFHLEWAAPSLTAAPDAVPDASLPSVFTVMGQLGLKLESTKGTGEFLVIDSVERPTEN